MNRTQRVAAALVVLAAVLGIAASWVAPISAGEALAIDAVILIALAFIAAMAGME